jgi:DNA repair photolyase
MPGLNDDPRQVEPILEAAAEAGATGIGGIALHLRGEVKGIFMEWLRSYRPDLVPRYEELYRRGAYAPPEERERIAALVRRERRSPAPFARGSRGLRAERREADPAPLDPPSVPKPNPVPVQQSLF